jgi:hypothetical protein
MKSNEVSMMKVNLGLVLRGEFSAVQRFLNLVETVVAEHDDMSAIYKNVSASKLWIMEGDKESD